MLTSKFLGIMSTAIFDVLENFLVFIGNLSKISLVVFIALYRLEVN